MENTQIPKDPNTQSLTAERLAGFRGDVESLKRRNQRFAQMLVVDFELLIAAAERVAECDAVLTQTIQKSAETLQVVNAYLRLRAEKERLRQESAYLREWGGRCQDEMEKQAARANELLSRIDALTEYLRHGPNCPADIATLTGLIPGKCDCGLMELVAGNPQNAALSRAQPQVLQPTPTQGETP